MRYLAGIAILLVFRLTSFGQIVTDTPRVLLPKKADTGKLVPLLLPAGIKVLSPEVQQNRLFYNSDKDKTNLKTQGYEYMQLFEQSGKFKADIFKSTEESAFIFHSPQEDLPLSGRVLTGPSQYDSRVEPRSLDPTLGWVKGILKNAYSVAVVVSRSRIRRISKSFYQLDDSNTLGSTYNLCPGEAFRDQPVVGTGTAIVTGKRQMLTAGHVFAAPAVEYAVIFGYEITTKKGGYETIIPADSIYFPVRIDQRSDDLDIAVFTVDRDLKAPALIWSTEIGQPVNEPVYMIGFPYGLPKKVAANASIIGNNDQLSLYTSLDAFQGNSGSPVFNLNTNEVVGILVSGGTDFNWNGSCNVSVVCSAPYCQGEKATRASAIQNEFGSKISRNK